MVTYNQMYDALKAYYEVECDDSLIELINDSDDIIHDVVSALKLILPPNEGI